MAERPQDRDRNQEATVYLGNLDEKCTDALIWELMLQAGPVSNVHLPKDRISQSHQGFGFCEFLTEDDADYACKIMNQIKLFGKPIRVNKASYDKKQLDVGANLFIGNLDPMVDENLLYTTFSSFGLVSQQAKIARDPSTGESKGYGFISYNDFASSDAAIESMDNQHLMNKPVTVQYAFKKDGKGERHGTPAERLLAAQAKKHQLLPVGGMGIGTGANGYMPPPPPAGFGQATGYQAPYPGQPPAGFPNPMQGYAPTSQGSFVPPPPPPTGFASAPQGASQPPYPQYGQQQFGQPGMGYPPQQMGMPGMNGAPPPPPPGFMTGANSMPVPGR